MLIRDFRIVVWNCGVVSPCTGRRLPHAACVGAGRLQVEGGAAMLICGLQECAVGAWDCCCVEVDVPGHAWQWVRAVACWLHGCRDSVQVQQTAQQLPCSKCTSDCKKGWHRVL